MSKRFLLILSVLIFVSAVRADNLEQARRLVYDTSERIDGVNQALADAAALRAQGEHDAALDALRIVERDVLAVQSGQPRVDQALERARQHPPVFPEPDPDDPTQDDPADLYWESLDNLEQMAGWQVTTAQIKLAEVHFYSAMNYFGLMSRLFAEQKIDNDISVDDEAALVLARIERLRLGYTNGEQAQRLAEQAQQALAEARRMLPPDGDVVLEANLDHLEPQVTNLFRLIDEERERTLDRQVTAQVELGLVLLKDNRYSQALREIENARRFIEDHPLINRAIAEVHYVHGLEYLQNGQERLAETKFDEALGFDQKHVGAHLELGRLELTAGNYTAAETRLTRASELGPRRAEGWYLLALSRVGQGRHRDALAPFEKAADLGYGVACYRDWGTALETLDDSRRAARVFEDGLRAPDGPDPVLDARLAYNYAVRGTRHSDAVSLARRSLEGDGPLEYAWPALLLASFNDRSYLEIPELGARALEELDADAAEPRSIVHYVLAANHNRTREYGAALEDLDAVTVVPDWLSRDHRRLLDGVVRELTREIEGSLRSLDSRRSGLEREKTGIESQLAGGPDEATAQALNTRKAEIEATLDELAAQEQELRDRLAALRGR